MSNFKPSRLTLVLLLALFFRLPGLFWGELYKNHFIVLEPDEYQHLDLTVAFLKKLDPSVFPDYNLNRYNALGFGTQMGLLSYLPVKLLGAEFKTLLLMGRGLSIVYGILLVLLVYRATLFFTKQEKAALMAAGCMAVCDLAATYSHYAIPEMAYIFWVFFSLFAMTLLLGHQTPPDSSIFFLKNQHLKFWLFTILALGMTLAMKFDFIPCLVFAAWFALQVWLKKWKPSALLALGACSVIGVYFFFKAGIGFQTGWPTLLKIIRFLHEENNHLIAKDNHLVYNPPLYLIGIAAGMGLPACLLAIAGIKHLKNTWHDMEENARQMLVFASILLALEFLLLWKLDAPFVRRCLIFMPPLAILAGVGAHYIVLKNSRLWLIGGAVYTIALTAVSQWNFVHDTRYEAKEFLQKENRGEKLFFIDNYAYVNGMPPIASIDQADFIVIHETKFSRYWKSFATPFKIPLCCEEVYHCGGEQECQFYQKLLSGESEFRQVKKIEPFDWAPERLIFKHFFGTYETFLGDVLIFEK